MRVRPRLCNPDRYALLGRQIEMRGTFVHEQDFRFAVQRPGQQDPLPLAAGQASAHIVDQAIIAHWHGGNIVMNAGKSGATFHLVNIVAFIEKTNVIGNRSR